jgi:hypothetical protein
MRLILHRAILGPDYAKMALYGRPPEIGPVAEGEARFQALKWLPGLPSQSAILWDNLILKTRRAARGQMKITISA